MHSVTVKINIRLMILPTIKKETAMLQRSNDTSNHRKKLSRPMILPTIKMILPTNDDTSNHQNDTSNHQMILPTVSEKKICCGGISDKRIEEGLKERPRKVGEGNRVHGDDTETKSTATCNAGFFYNMSMSISMSISMSYRRLENCTLGSHYFRF